MLVIVHHVLDKLFYSLPRGVRDDQDAGYKRYLQREVSCFGCIPQFSILTYLEAYLEASGSLD